MVNEENWYKVKHIDVWCVLTIEEYTKERRFKKTRDISLDELTYCRVGDEFRAIPKEEEPSGGHYLRVIEKNDHEVILMMISNPIFESDEESILKFICVVLPQ